MSTTMKQIDISKLTKYVPLLSDFDKGRLTGIGEGMAMAFDAEKAKQQEPQKEEMKDGA